MALPSSLGNAPSDCGGCETVGFFSEVTVEEDDYGVAAADAQADDEFFESGDDYGVAEEAAPAPVAISPLSSIGAPVADGVHSYNRKDCEVCGGFTLMRGSEPFQLSHNSECPFKDGNHTVSAAPTAASAEEEELKIGHGYYGHGHGYYGHGHGHGHGHGYGHGHRERSVCVEQKKEAPSTKKCYDEEVYEVTIDDIDILCSKLASACTARKPFEAKFNRNVTSSDGKVTQTMAVSATVKPKSGNLVAIDVKLAPFVDGAAVESDAVMSRVFKVDTSGSKLSSKLLARGVEKYRDGRIAAEYVHAALGPISAALEKVGELVD